MIDELSLGLAPVLVEQLIESLIALNKEGLSIFVVEQDVVTALEVSQTSLVMDQGRIVRQGPSAELLADPSIRSAYLGE
jgi:branched-chain amino acid transport system ATP-binding protein